MITPNLNGPLPVVWRWGRVETTEAVFINSRSPGLHSARQTALQACRACRLDHDTAFPQAMTCCNRSNVMPAHINARCAA